MKFENAYVGIKKVFTAQILALIASACVLVAAILLGVGVATGTSGGAIAGGVIGSIISIGGAVISIIALIINLVGLNTASKDEDKFKTAFILSIINLIIGILLGLGSLIPFITTISPFIQVARTILDFLIIYYVIEGIKNLATKCGRQDVYDMGKKLFILLSVVYIVSVLCSLAVSIGGSVQAILEISGVLSIVVSIASIVGYIIYLVYLKKAVNMLETAKAE